MVRTVHVEIPTGALSAIGRARGASGLSTIPRVISSCHGRDCNGMPMEWGGRNGGPLPACRSPELSGNPK